MAFQIEYLDDFEKEKIVMISAHSLTQGTPKSLAFVTFSIKYLSDATAASWCFRKGRENTPTVRGSIKRITVCMVS